MSDFSPNIDDLKKFKSWMAAVFHQTWDLDSDGKMLMVIEREFCQSPETAAEVASYIDKVLMVATAKADASEFLQQFSGDYDPNLNGMLTIEWLVLLKQYLRGNKRAFDAVLETNNPPI